jgi:hypothetical protein
MISSSQKRALLESIARDNLRHIENFDGLAARHSDSLDFHEISVWTLEKMLSEAFEAGRAS